MIDFATIAAGATVAPETDLPTSARKGVEPNPFAALVAKAAKDGKRYDLPGRFSLAPFEGRKAACEAFTVISKLHQAARSAGVKLAVRRFDTTAEGCRVTFKVAK
jgi:hypothetical protein